MKLTKLIFLFALTIATVSCSKNDDNDNYVPDPYRLTVSNFVDTYKLKFLEIKEVETITFGNGTTSTSTTTIVGSIFQNVNFVFNANGAFAATGFFTTIQTTINPDGSTTTEDPVIRDAAVEMGSGTYTLNVANKTLTVSDGSGEAVSFEVRDYTETGMTLYSTDTEVSNNSSITTTIEYRFSR